MSASELKRLKETEVELSQYKRMYAEVAHENYALKDLIEKKLVDHEDVLLGNGILKYQTG